MLALAYTILVVDDEIQNIELAEIILKKEGYTLFFAQNAQEMFHCLEQQTIDVILLDLMLPDMDGFAILEKFQQEEHTKHTKVIVVSALNDTSTIDKTLLLGADGYVSKPYDILSLKSKVKEMLQQSHSIQIDAESYLNTFFSNVSNTMTNHSIKKITLYFIESIISEDTIEALKFIHTFFTKEIYIENFILNNTNRVFQSSLNRAILKHYSKEIPLEYMQLLQCSKKYFIEH